MKQLDDIRDSAAPDESTTTPTGSRMSDVAKAEGVRIVAVIDIGATSVRMAIAQIDAAGEIQILESLSQAVSLGKDVFIHGVIHADTIEDCVRVLNIYRLKLSEYQITSPDDIRVVATSAVREATNRLAFADRIFIGTGLEVEPFDEAELHRVTFLGVNRALRHPDLASIDQVLVCEVGGGSTETLVVRNDDVAFSQAFRLGALRLRRTLEAYHTPGRKIRSVMERTIGRTAALLKEQIDPNRKLCMLAMGGDLRFATSQLIDDWNQQQPIDVPVESFEKFIESVVDLSIDELVTDFHLSFPDAESLVPALLIYTHIARAVGVKSIRVANVNLRDGLLLDMATADAWTSEFSAQTIRAAKALGRKFHTDETHAEHVAELSRKLFQQLAPTHQLDSRYELLLYIAALLHEVGMYVSHRSLHKHSMYLIRNSDLFGLGKRDLLLVALIARYHRRASPQPNHEGYSELNRLDRVAIAKLAAILRISKALDESRGRRIQDVECQFQGKQLVLEVPNVDDLSLEQISIQQASRLFTEIYGKNVVLRARRR